MENSEVSVSSAVLLILGLLSIATIDWDRDLAEFEFPLK